MLWRGRLFAQPGHADRSAVKLAAGFAVANANSALMKSFLNRLLGNIGWALTELGVWLAEVRARIICCYVCLFCLCCFFFRCVCLCVGASSQAARSGRRTDTRHEEMRRHFDASVSLLRVRFPLCYDMI